MIRDLIKQLWKDRFARIALVVLGIIYFALFFADFIAPYTKDFSDRTMAYVPPSKIFTIDENGKFSKPYTYNYKREFENYLFIRQKSKTLYKILFSRTKI